MFQLQIINRLGPIFTPKLENFAINTKIQVDEATICGYREGCYASGALPVTGEEEYRYSGPVIEAHDGTRLE